MFLERFRNVVQAIVNKKSQKKSVRPKGVLFKGVLFNFQDLCGEGGLDAEHLLLCGPPYTAQNESKNAFIIFYFAKKI